MSAAQISMADVYGRLRTQIRTAGSQRAFAERIGLSPAFISQVLNGARPPTDAMLRQVGLRRVVVLEEIAPAPLRTGTGAVNNPMEAS